MHKALPKIFINLQGLAKVVGEDPLASVVVLERVYHLVEQK